MIKSLCIPLLLVWDQVIAGGGAANAEQVNVTLLDGEADVSAGLTEKLGEPVMVENFC